MPGAALIAGDTAAHNTHTAPVAQGLRSAGATQTAQETNERNLLAGIREDKKAERNRVALSPWGAGRSGRPRKGRLRGVRAEQKWKAFRKGHFSAGG